mgnify:CR=1 FL=1
MKSILTLITLIFNLSVFSQITCIDFSEYSDDYVNLVGSDDDTYPVGTVFMENGDLKLVKPEGETSYLSVGVDEFTFIGNVDIDVSSFLCPHKILRFSLMDGSSGISVDGDVICTEFEDFPAFYEGDSFEFEYTPEDGITIIGDFDVVSIFGYTNILGEVCIECDEGAGESDCINFYDYTDEYVSAVGLDDDTYPVGTVFIENGDLKLVKADGPTNYLSVSGGEFIFNGNLDINVSSSMCESKVLTFSIITISSNGLSVDGDIISDIGEDFPEFYVGDDFEYEFDGEVITITGSFSAVSLFGATNTLSDVCLECGEPVAGTNCIDFDEYTDDYVSMVGLDDETYPAGTVFMENGDLKLVKPDGITNYISVGGDEFTFHGAVDIDISSASCDIKVLTFSIDAIASNGLSVDGEIISNLGEEFPATYDGASFDYEFDGDETIIISGEFDIVSLFGVTNRLSGVCLECVSTVSVGRIEETNEFNIFPNPTSGSSTIVLQFVSGPNYELTVSDLSGQVLYTDVISSENILDGYELDMSYFESGVYIVHLINDSENRQKKLIKK